LQESFRRGAKEHAVNNPLVLEGYGRDQLRQGEDDVKYSTGSSSAARCSSHAARAALWHFGQWRLRQEQ